MFKFLAATLLGITGMLSIPAPAAGDPPPEAVVYFVGDSITAGAGGGIPARDGFAARARDRICGTYQGCRARVVTVSGSGGCLVVSCGGLPSLQSTWVSQILEATPKPTTVIVEIGVNDLFMSVTDQQYGSAYLYLFQQAAARGIRVILGTMTPTTTSWPWHNAHNPQRMGINTWLRNYFGGANIVDFDAALRIGFTGDADPTYYSGGDGLHPNTLGHLLMSDVLPIDRIQ